MGLNGGFKMQKYGVIFDLDGTLWDVADVTHMSANEVAEKYGLHSITKKAVLDSFGLPKEGSAKNFFPDLPLRVSVPYTEEIIASNIDNLFKLGGKIYPDAKPVLAKLKDEYDLFIVTNSPFRRYAEAFLVSTGTAAIFKEYCSAGELSLTKAQAIKRIVDDFELKKAVYVGDTETDCLSSAEAGVEFIYANYGFGNVADAEYVISALKELPDVIERVFTKE